MNINGTLNFGSAYSAYSNSALSAAGANTSIYPFWDDLVTDASPYDQRPIYYATIGSAPNRKFIAQWTNMYFFSTTIQMGTFQVILNETTNVVQIQYRDLLGGTRALGDSATIGLKKDNFIYSQYSNNIASLTQGQALVYTPNGSDSFTLESSVPGEGEEVGALYDLVYLAPEGAPTSPVLVNPTDETSGVTTTPTFEWLPVEGATSYTVLISTVSNFSSTVVNQSGITDLSYTLGSALNTDTQYYWRVQAVNANGSSLSSTRTFTTGAANTAPNIPGSVSSGTLIGAVENSNPVGSVLTALLSDDDEAEQVRYRIQIATDTDFLNLVIDYRSPFGDEGEAMYTVGENTGTYLLGAADTSFAVADYYLRIRAEDDAAASSDWHTASGVAFTVPVDETGPVISDVATTAVSSDSATVTWLTDEIASSRVEYGLVSAYGWQTAEVNTSPRVTSHSIALSELKACGRYFYRVISTDSNSNQTTSTQHTVTTSGCEVSSVQAGSESSITTSGGTISHTNGNILAVLEVPADFSNEGARFQINQLVASEIPSAPNGMRLANNTIYDLLAVSDSNVEIENFDEPISFVITYGSDTESAFDEPTLDVFRFTNGTWEKKNCVLDSTANTLTCSLSSFSTYAVFGESNSNDQESTSVQNVQPRTNTAQSCSAKKPESAPTLFQIQNGTNSVQLFFVPVINNTSGYVISYGNTPEANDHAYSFNYSDSSGMVSQTIGELKNGSLWYFKVQAKNECVGGPWSAVKFTTLGALSNKISIKNKEVETSGDSKESSSSAKAFEHEYSEEISSNTGESIKKHVVVLHVKNQGKPVPNTKIVLKDTQQEVVTDDTGIAKIEGVVQGKRTFSIVHQAFAAEESVDISGDEESIDIEINIELKNSLFWVK